MSIEAHLSKYKKHNMLIMAVIFIVAGGWFYYDGYHNPTFIKKHTIDGQPDDTLKIHLYGFPFLFAAGAVTLIRFWMIKDKKVVVDDQGLHCEKTTILYDRIDSIDKTHFDSKGFFVIHYKDDQQQVVKLKLSDRLYDNLPAVLDHLVSKMT
jgi:hypothetical protein